MSVKNSQRNVKNNLFHPQYIIGFVDGEGSFHIAIYKDKNMKTGIKIIPEFHVSQRISSKKVLDGLKKYFQCGYIKANHAKNYHDTTYVYVVRNRDDLLNIIIPFFEKYSFKTEKQKDFILFAKIVKQMKNKTHLSLMGVKKIIFLAYQMNQKGKYRKKKYKI